MSNEYELKPSTEDNPNKPDHLVVGSACIIGTLEGPIMRVTAHTNPGWRGIVTTEWQNDIGDEVHVHEWPAVCLRLMPDSMLPPPVVPPAVH